MTLNKLASLIAQKEGKKSQVAIGNIREVIKAIVDIEVESVINDPQGEGALAALTEAVNKKLLKASKKKVKK